LDETTRSAYRARLGELRLALAEAEERADVERAEALRSEIDALARELRRAFGRGGRGRNSGSASERARINVTRAIAAAINRIRAQHRGLGHYLDRSIQTGTSCTYKPGLDQLVDWQL
jgi:hypothetical protein